MKTTLEYLLLLLLFLSPLVLLSASGKCHRFRCGKFSNLGFPFSDTSNPKCGLAVMNCTGDAPLIQFSEKGKWYQVDYINDLDQPIFIRDLDVQSHLESNHCDLLNNFTEKVSPFLGINLTGIRPFFKCKRAPPYPSFFKSFGNYSCKDYDLYFYLDPKKHLPALPQNLSGHCSVVHSSRLFYVPDSGSRIYNNTLLYASDFVLKWQVHHLCRKCHGKGGQCFGSSEQTFECGNLKGARVKLAIGFSSGVGCAILACIIFFLYQRRKKKKFSKSSNLIARDISDHSMKPDNKNGSIYFQTPIFTYKELDKATNHFDTNKKVGEGGFGTVYHGKLRDGRIVAVKRLFEHNYKRVEQFMNEIAILSRLRHQNLVLLYGCTSRHSRELLLVYEYVPNGTVADHIHGERAKAGLLTWPIRMSIAIESADALAYLHASDTIHRDVKTKNILLDNGFHVKVADFGLSRLFPTDVSHVSTAPQGTPGYVDPEYYQCYQLNDKSDVYSFGVVLIELISSKPAVDIGRHRHEVNLASLAINKIHNRALHELVDPSLGFKTDYNTRNMITSVAELAFRCLQLEKEMRPCMVEVVEVLRAIESEDYRKKTDEMDASADISLLKNIEPLSPVSDTDKWASKSSTPNTSAGGNMYVYFHSM